MGQSYLIGSVFSIREELHLWGIVGARGVTHILAQLQLVRIVSYGHPRAHYPGGYWKSGTDFCVGPGTTRLGLHGARRRGAQGN
jgi:hypothetical protein